MAIPQVPADTAVCRWCGRRLRALLEGGPADYCERGCAKNDAAPYLGHCGECGRSFVTGRRLLDAVLCATCEQKEITEQPNEEPSKGRTYHYSTLGRGGYRD